MREPSLIIRDINWRLIVFHVSREWKAAINNSQRNIKYVSLYLKAPSFFGSVFHVFPAIITVNDDDYFPSSITRLVFVM